MLSGQNSTYISLCCSNFFFLYVFQCVGGGGVGMCMCVSASLCKGQRTIYGSQFFPYTMLISGIELWCQA